MTTYRLSDLVNERRIKTPLTATDKVGILQELAELAAADLPSVGGAEEILDALERRERQGPISMGGGVAFPHARVEKEIDLSLSIGILPQGCDFKAPDGRPILIVVLLAIPKKHSNLYVRTLAALLNFFSSDERKNALLAAASPTEVLRTIAQDGQTMKEE